MLIQTVSMALLALAAVANAQPAGGGRFGPPGRGPGPAPDAARLIGAVAGNPRSVVKSAPYSAEVVTETTQVLADGNRIRRTVTSKVYRDAEGRVRTEQSLAGLGMLAPNSAASQVVYINDPVAGANYALNVKEKTATKSSLRGGPPGPPQAGGPPGMGRGQAMGAQRGFPGRGDAMGRGGPRPNGAGRGGADQNVKTESLGRQTIEGVAAEGTRTTFTIPAGQMGNDLALQVVSEAWYSPDLQITVMSRHSDPLAGETVYRLTNINRSAPAASLFQPPPDFAVSDATPPRSRE
jgi:hypothetical protein